MNQNYKELSTCTHQCNVFFFFFFFLIRLHIFNNDELSVEEYVEDIFVWEQLINNDSPLSVVAKLPARDASYNSLWAHSLWEEFRTSQWLTGSDTVLQRLNETPYHEREQILADLLEYDPPGLKPWNVQGNVNCYESRETYYERLRPADFSFLPHPCAMLSRKDLLRLFKKLPKVVVDHILRFEPPSAGGKLRRALQSARLCVQVARKLTFPLENDHFTKVQVDLLSTVLCKACDFVKAATGGLDWWTQKEKNCVDGVSAARWDPLISRWRLESATDNDAKKEEEEESEKVQQLMKMGFSKEQATKALAGNGRAWAVMATTIEDLQSKERNKIVPIVAGRTFEMYENSCNEGNDLYDFFVFLFFFFFLSFR